MPSDGGYSPQGTAIDRDDLLPKPRWLERPGVELTTTSGLL
jgi:hypothetical protein